ncbi:hypothetical protein CORC01_00020 [Colletotrichum orchidophilum]|uniref:Uncharacterized protein n=1 Tax=Colletotrichum orchidophilum TaxID=1209926 RepID=A0A1G4BSZ2_9PEZI|nr:uncharacterized protein CORC01_00020 [Colletotrichum orchidophilum]OHF04549.1 hypothetical protein CORC01_00020 [Colletotrichum orchidophilum]
MFKSGTKNGLVATQDEIRAENAIQDAVLIQVEKNLKEKTGDDDGSSDAALRRTVVDTGYMLKDPTVWRMYVDGFVPVKERSRRIGNERWLSVVCYNF